MKLFLAEEMKEIDNAVTREFGLPGLLLMENAGRDVAATAESILEDCHGKRIVVFAGKGNNAGDGFAAARTLLNRGAQVTVILLADMNSYSGDAFIQLEVLRKCNPFIFNLNNEQDWDKAKIAGELADLVIDGLLGTGFHGELNADFARAVELINSVAAPVLAIDIPSGVEPDTGKVARIAVKADVTVTIAMPKPGLYLYPGAEYAGEIMVAEIGIPEVLLAEADSKNELVTRSLAKTKLPFRQGNAHKGMAGRVAVLAGSPGFTGAAALCSFAAVKAGAGLVTLLTPLSSQNILAAKLNEVMVQGLIERLPGVLGGGAVGDVRHWLEKSDVLAVGPGLGTSEATKEVIRDILQGCGKPVVIDADALTALVENTEILLRMKCPKIITPHPAEMARLIGAETADVDADRLAVASLYAVEWQTVVVLKGAPTVVAAPDGSVYINTTGNEGMATGGCGDVLTGIIAALLGQGLSAADAAVLGVYLHGLAADFVAENGKIGLAAGQISEFLPRARQMVEEE
ncbi:MAG: NAD(P)H-hydrate dehydratase [Acidaminococcaceae bacterium]